MQTALKNVELLKHFKIRKMLQHVSVYKETNNNNNNNNRPMTLTHYSSWRLYHVTEYTSL